MRKMNKMAAVVLGAGFFIGTVGMTAPKTTTAEGTFSYRNYATTYEMQTGIAMPPSIAFEITCAYDVEALATEKTPAVAIIYANEQGQAVDTNGNAIAPIDEVVRACDNRVIPAFTFESENAMNAVLRYVEEKNLVDMMVFSENAELVKKFKAQRSNCQAGVIFRDMDWNKENVAVEIRNTVNSNNAMIAVVDGEAPKEVVEKIQMLGLTCWATVKATEYDIYNALHNGVNGMVMKNFTMPIEIVESFTEPTMIRKTFMSGHRGESSFPENTILSAQAAYYYGADYIELDLMRTKDDKLIVMHDETLNRTCLNYTGDQLISEMTLEEIQQYKVQITANGAQYAIPTLDEYFEFVSARAEDLKLLVELKTNDEKVVPLLVEKIEEYGVEDNIIVISAYNDRLVDFKNSMPNVSTGGLGSLTTITAMTNFCYRYNSSFGPWYDYLEKNDGVATMSQAIARGIPVYSWTYKSVEKFEQYIFLNTSLTTDVCTYADEQVTKLELSLNDVYELSAAIELDLTGTVTMRGRKSPHTNEKFTAAANLSVRNAPVISSALKSLDQVATYADGKLSVDRAGYGVCLVSHKWKSSYSDVAYDVYAKPIKIVYNVDAKEYETEVLQADYDPEKSEGSGSSGNSNGSEGSSGCGSIVSFGSGAAILFCAAIGIAMKKKHEKK